MVKLRLIKFVDGTIVDADINASAAIANTKIADGLLKSTITVNSANIVDGSIVNDDVSNSANISGSKLADDCNSCKVRKWHVTKRYRSNYN